MKFLILISGKMHSGKSTSAKIINEIMTDMGYKSEIVALADELKSMSQEAFKPLSKILKEKFDFDLTDDNFWENKNDISRCLLQIIGSDIVRTVDVNYWCRKLHEKIQKSDSEFFMLQDWRFNSEFKYFLELNDVKTYCINVKRLGLSDSDARKHISENDLNNFEYFNKIVENNGDMKDLEGDLVDVAEDIISWHINCYDSAQTPFMD